MTSIIGDFSCLASVFEFPLVFGKKDIRAVTIVLQQFSRWNLGLDSQTLPKDLF